MMCHFSREARNDDTDEQEELSERKNRYQLDDGDDQLR